METWFLFKWIFKTFVAVYLVTHTFDLIMAVFELSQHIVNQSAGIVSGDTSIDFAEMIGDLTSKLEAMGKGELFLVLVESLLIKLTMFAVYGCVMLVLYGRMIEIFIFCSISPIPFATMANREWGQIGNNYLRGLVALGIQGFFILVCVAIYSVLIREIASTDSIHIAMANCAAYTILLCYSLFKTGGVSKSILNAH